MAALPTFSALARHRFRVHPVLAGTAPGAAETALSAAITAYTVESDRPFQRVRLDTAAARDAFLAAPWAASLNTIVAFDGAAAAAAAFDVAARGHLVLLAVPGTTSADAAAALVAAGAPECLVKEGRLFTSAVTSTPAGFAVAP